MSPTRYARVRIVAYVAGLRHELDIGDPLPADLDEAALDDLRRLDAIDEADIDEPNSSVSEAGGSNEPGAAGGAIPGTHNPAGEGSGAAAEVVAAPVMAPQPEPGPTDPHARIRKPTKPRDK